MNKISALLLFALSLICFSCSHSFEEEEDLSTTPITNNPNIVPRHGSGLPMVPGG